MKGNTKAQTPAEYIDSLEGKSKKDIGALDAFIRKTVPAFEPYMQSGMLAYGSYHFVYASGKEVDWCVIALASQKNYISLYICMTEGDVYLPELYKDKLPKANIGKSCIRFKKIEDIDLNVIKELLLHAKKAVDTSATVTKNS